MIGDEMKVTLDTSSWTRLGEVWNYAEQHSVSLPEAIQLLVNSGLSHEPQDYTMPERWVPANNGTGKRIWFVCRHLTDGPYPKIEYHTDRNGDLIRYTREGAYRKAQQLNA
jgi:hypothetical protein